MQTIWIPKAVETIINKLESHGHRADIVGGCVRDALLMRQANDYDITTDASPEQTCEIFKDYRTLDTGLKHGTLTVMIDGEGYEVTTYRRDGEYKDHRHPDEVFFTDSLTEDLSRRDFTVNAICYSPKYGITDPFFGIEDIKRKIIRAVGEPAKRFDEDALRIMRAVRFAATLGFEIEEQTSLAVKKKRELLNSVSGERILVELSKLVASYGAYDVIAEYKEVIAAATGYGDIRLPLRERFNAEDDWFVRFFAFFCDENGVGDVNAFNRACERLHADNKLKRSGIAVLASLNERVESRQEIKLALFELGADNVRLLMRLQRLVGKSADSALAELDSVLSSDNEPWSYRQLAIRGNDLEGIGIRGVELGAVLRSLLISVIKGEADNERGELIALAKKLHG